MTTFLKAIALVLVVVFGLSRCNSETRQAKNELIAGCVQSGQSKDVCKCTADKVIEHYGDKAIAEMRRTEMMLPDLPTYTLRAAAQCIQG